MTQVNHKQRAHAILSPSSAHRWLVCTPSARLEDREPDESSEFAAHGTLAHEFGDIGLRHLKGDLSDEAYEAERARLRENPLYDDEMEGYAEQYIEYVAEQVRHAKVKTPDAEILIEQKVDLSGVFPECFGSVDTNIVADDTLEVIDYKHGKGVTVSAENNPQLMIYGLGSLIKYDCLYDIQTVRLTIIQPRTNNYSSWEISADDLWKWGEAQKEIAQKAFDGTGIAVAGPHCKFCKVKHKCGTLASLCTRAAQRDFDTGELKDPYTLTDDQILEVAQVKDLIVLWANAVTDYMEKSAVNDGKNWKGFKVVEANTKRKIADVQGAILALETEGLERSQFIDEKLKSMTNLKKVLKSAFDDVIGEFVIKPQGKPVLVPETDKRPIFDANKQAVEDFS